MVLHKSVCVLLTDSAGQRVATHGPRTGDSFEFYLSKLRFPEGDPAVQGTMPHTHLLKHADEVLSAAFGPGGEVLITGDGKRTREVTRGSLHYWNTATGEQVGPPVEFPNPVANVQLTPDGKRVIVLSSATTPASVQKTGRFTEEEAVHVYELPSLRPAYPPLPHLGEAHLLSLSRDGESMLVAGSLDLQARLWSVSTGKAIGKPLQHDAGVTAAALSPDGRLAATSAFDGSLRVWNTDTQDEIHRPIPASELRSDPTVESIAISRDGRLLASVDTAGRVKLWTLPEARPVCPPIELKPTVVSLAFDPGGKLLLTATMNGAMQLWSAEDGSSIGPPLSEEGNLFGACFSADGSLILGKTVQGIRVWHSPAP
jgi:WD40 repeat protein